MIKLFKLIKKKLGIVSSTDRYLIWLEKRIETLTKERDSAQDLHIIIVKGARLTSFKEIKNYILEHN